MFRPPPDYKWKQQVNIYQAKFRRKVPQWVLTLSLDEAAKLLSTCIYLNYKLPPDVLIPGEPLGGYGGLWSPSRNGWDVKVNPSTIVKSNKE
jgi:hypothetical protein